MSLKQVLDVQKNKLRPSSEELKILTRRVRTVVSSLRTELKKSKQVAHVFVGGSFAKGTLVKKERYDIDIFVRFETFDEKAITLLDTCVKTLSKQQKLHVQRVHGSRDYFQLESAEGIVFEIIPVQLIRKPSQAQNVTDLSYFHVAYVAPYTRRLGDEIRLAKQFCHAQDVYGAESYIRGFSGYGLECLIINYKSFASFLRALVRAKTPLILDPARHYKNLFEARLSLNEAKTQAPIILIDPTHKERNVLAALSEESFLKLQAAARIFLKRPAHSAFVPVSFDASVFAEKMRSKKYKVACLRLTTDRQVGDIAGTKLKKVARYLTEKVGETFMIHKDHFVYDGMRQAHLYLAYTSLPYIERRGPLTSMKSASEAFKRHHTTAFVKKGRWWAHIHAPTELQKVLGTIKQQREQLYDMGVTDITLEKI